MKIKKIIARKILNSLGNPTIEVIVNRKYTCSAPVGITMGTYAMLMYSEDIDHTINVINNLKQIKGLKINEFNDLSYLDDIKQEIGANGTYALQGAILKALADNNVWKFLNPHADKLPIPIGNCIGGGLHGKNDVDFQEFLLIPIAKDFSDNSFANDYIYKRIGQELNIKERNYQGAWAPNLNTTAILDILSRNAELASNNLGFKINLGININANYLFKDNKYQYKNFSSEKKEKILTKDEHIQFINSLVEDYNLFYIEDPMEENDPDSYDRIKAKIVCSDNLTCTNLSRLEKFKDKITAVIVKPNQLGSLTLLKEFIDYAKENKIIPIISHRTAETKDDLIAHLAVAWEIPFIKCGIFGKERLSKINALRKIEQEIKS